MLSNSRIKILFLIPNMRGGGSERVIATLLRHLDKSRFSLVLAVLDMSGAAYMDESLSNVQVLDLQSKRVRHAIPKIVQLIWRLRPNVVFSTLGHLNLAVAMLRPILPNGTRYIAREATIVSALTDVYHAPKWWFLLYRLFYPRFDLVVCQSKAMQEDLVKNFRLPSNRTVVIHNPVEIERIRELSASSEFEPEICAGCINLVAVGSLTPVKDFGLLIEAVSLACSRPIAVTIVGEGPLLDRLRAQAAEKCGEGRVRFVGFKKNPYVYLKNADALVVTSRFEGFPNVVLEALACGTPVIAVPCPGGIAEILNGVSGCIVSSERSAQNLSEILLSFQAGTRVAANVVDHYAAANIVSSYEDVFSQVHH